MLPALSTFAEAETDELEHYLNSPVENIPLEDGIAWWIKNKATYPRLYRMALDYLSIPGTHSLH
jgi:hypothetical protein